MTETVLLAHAYFLYYDEKQTRKMRPYAPLATLIAGQVLRERGHRVELFDSMLSSGTAEFEALLRRTKPSTVAILDDNFNFLSKMCTTRMRDAELEMIRMSHSMGAKVVVNGSDASDRPRSYLDAGADAIIVGETEETLPELLSAWRSGSPVDEIRGLVLPGEGELRRTPARALATDLDALPLPAWDLVDVELYRRAWIRAHGRLSWSMVSTRGCPYGCNWCAKPLYGRRYAQRSPGDVASEMQALQRRLAPDHIWFADDVFGLTPLWIESLAVELESRDVRIPFTLQSRVDLMTESACRALAHAGAEEAWLGVESGTQAILDRMEKEISLDMVRRATRRLRAHGVRPSWFLQLGYPGEDWAAILSTRDLIREESPHDIGVSVSYPLPGTRFHEMVSAQVDGKTNWNDSDDLAMLFNGTYGTVFYRKVRDLLHEEALVAVTDDGVERASRTIDLDRAWDALGEEEGENRHESPTVLPGSDSTLG
ncbi:MAG: hypothetical protein CME06_06535 [Gemmatimonadetes bacterium]|nr:hypothetical protein [Gemmatimonadota bacterium]